MFIQINTFITSVLFCILLGNVRQIYSGIFIQHIAFDSFFCLLKLLKKNTGLHLDILAL